MMGFHNNEEVLIPISQMYGDDTLEKDWYWISEWLIGKNIGEDPELFDVFFVETENTFDDYNID
jgi:hypothetical protein